MPDATERHWRRDKPPGWNSVGVWTATAISRTLATYAILQGVTVVLYGPDRWHTSHALQNALLIPGRTLTWGLLLATAGTVALLGSLTRRMRWTALGHVLAGGWSLFFAVSQAPALLPGSPGPTTGVLVYGAEAVIFLTLAVGSWKLR